MVSFVKIARQERGLAAILRTWREKSGNESAASLKQDMRWTTKRTPRAMIIHKLTGHSWTWLGERAPLLVV